MGLRLTAFYREKVKSEWKLAFFSAFIAGLLVHLFKFTNVLPNADALYNFYSSQNMVASGRWLLAVACSLGSWFDLPWVNGMLSLLFMGLTAAVVAEVFSMKNPCLIILTSGLLVSFPAITATMSYEFTADGYMLSMLLAAVSVALTRMQDMERGCWKNMVLSGLCICLSCGIYQAYVSFAFVLAVCYFMTELLENRYDLKRMWRWIGIQVLVYGAALACYYGIWKICLAVQGFTASTYQGIDSVGSMSGGDLIHAVLRIVKEFVRFFLEWNILDHGITVYSGLNILFLAAFVLGLAAAAWKSGCFSRKLQILLLGLCVAALPFGCYIWYLTSPEVVYHSLMLQSVCLLYVFTAVVFDRWIRPKYADLVLVLLAAIVFNNSVTANLYYNYMNQSYEKTYSAAVELNTRIHLLDDGTVRYVAIYGGLENWDGDSHFRREELRQLGGWRVISRTILSPLFLDQYTEFELSYYRDNNIPYPVVENTPEIPAPQNWEFRFPLLTAAEQEALGRTQEVISMPVWPAAGSVQVVGDTVVVKLSEYEIPTAEPDQG